MDPRRVQDHLRASDECRSGRYIRVEPWGSSGVVFLSLVHGAAVIAEVTAGTWEWKLWHLPPALSHVSSTVKGGNLSAPNPITDLESAWTWLRLRFDVILADDIEPDREGCLDLGVQRPALATWRPFRRSADSDIAAEHVLSAIEAVIHDDRLRQEVPALHKVADGLFVVSADGVLPFQAYGSWHGYGWYFRYRHSYASLSIGPDAPISKPYWFAETIFGGDGATLDLPEFAYLFTYLAAKLTRAEYLFTFDNGVRAQRVQAPTVEEAWMRLSPITTEPEAPWSLTDDDTRIWPCPEPDFTPQQVLAAPYNAEADDDALKWSY